MLQHAKFPLSVRNQLRESIGEQESTSIEFFLFSQFLKDFFVFNNKLILFLNSRRSPNLELDIILDWTIIFLADIVMYEGDALFTDIFVFVIFNCFFVFSEDYCNTIIIFFLCLLLVLSRLFKMICIPIRLIR